MAITAMEKGNYHKKHNWKKDSNIPYLVFQNKQPGSKFQIKNDSPVHTLI